MRLTRKRILLGGGGVVALGVAIFLFVFGKPLLFLAFIWMGSRSDHAGNLQDALLHFSRAAVIDPKNPLPWLLQSSVHHQLGEAKEALRDATRAVELAPTNVVVFLGRAALYSRLRDFDSALADATRAVELASDDTIAQALVARGQIQGYRGNIQAAIEDARAAIRARPD